MDTKVGSITIAGMESSVHLDKEKKIVVYCNSGGRSYGAYRKLMKLGYKKIFQVTFADWKEAGLPFASRSAQRECCGDQLN